MSPTHLKVLTTKTGALAATGLVATTLFASLPAAEALDTSSFGSVISASEAQTITREVPVDNTALLAAVEEARAAGLRVTEEQVKTITTGSTAEVQAALDTIAAEAESKIAEITAKIAQYKEETAAADAKHEAALTKFKKELADYEAKVAEAKANIEAGVCAPPRVAMTFDLSRSFDANETATMKGEAKKMVQRLSAVEGAEVSFFTFARDSAVNFQDTGAGEVPVGEITPISGNQPSTVFNIGTDAGKAAALAWIDGIDKHSKDAPVGTSGDEWNGVNYQTLGTNWEAALAAIEKHQAETGVKYDTALLLTDGAPNTYTVDGQVGIHSPVNASNGSDEAFNAAKVVADRLEASGTDIIPVMIRDEAVADPSHPFHFSSDEEGMINYIRGISGVASPGEGQDYFIGELDTLADSIYRAATIAAEKCIVDDPKPVEPTRDTVEAPSVSYGLTKLFAPIPVVDKVAAGEGKKVIAGETTTQTVSYATGYKAPESFVIGDHIYFTEDGRMPVSVDMAQVKVTDETGADVTELFTITAEDGVHNGKAGRQILATAKNPAGLKLNHTYTLHVNQTSLFDGIADTLTDAGFAIVNDELQYTSDKTYQEPTITPSKVDTSAVDGSNIDGKTVTVGDTISYKLVEDTTDLVDTTTAVKVSGMVDDFDERYGQIDPSQVRVYQVPGDTDTSTPEKVSAAVKLAAAKDVTGSYTVTNGEIEGFTNGGAVGISSMMKTEGEGEEQKVVLPMGYKYIHVLPYTVTANADGDILNTAWQVTNGARTQTETVANKLKEINPSKDVVIKVGDKDSIDGAEIALNTVFNYQLNSSTLPADRAGVTESWSIVDDYDETKDAYEGNFKVLSQHSFVDADGKTVEAGTDITKFFTQTHEGGKVTYTANEAFLALMSSEANRATEQGFSVFMQAQRIGVGEVLNTFVENYNGEQLVSNTVKTFTPEPPVPPVVPEDPAAVPPVPVTPEQPNKPVIKGEGAKTGGQATVAGIPVGVLAAGGVLFSAVVGAGLWLLVAGARKKNS
ncbi:LPXTG cell wall anchor domain-containing protein [Rothia nasimurium]|uniref:LPXTG cell wall anchor domain-containing protein n=1 Tax=Rothia nasimurium TaxID=85336 RepID=UPI0036156AAA